MARTGMFPALLVLNVWVLLRATELMVLVPPVRGLLNVQVVW